MLTDKSTDANARGPGDVPRATLRGTGAQVAREATLAEPARVGSPHAAGSAASMVVGPLQTYPDARCPVCSQPFGPRPVGIVCPKCQTPHHHDCWAYNGWCGVFACARVHPRPMEGKLALPPLPRTLPTIPVPRRDLFSTLFPVVLTVFLASIGVATIAVPRFKASRELANARACYANQLTVAGALEMYNLDKNTKCTLLNRTMWRSLTYGGYLCHIPQDPGAGSGSSSHYRWVSTRRGIECKVHGGIDE